MICMARAILNQYLVLLRRYYVDTCFSFLSTYLFFYFLAGAVALFGRGPWQHHIVSAGFGFFPIFSRVKRWHQYFLAIHRIHFLAHNLGDVVQNPQSQRQIAVNPGHFLVDKTAAQQELGVPGHFVCRRFFSGFGKKFGLSHLKPILPEKDLLVKAENITDGGNPVAKKGLFC